MTLERERLKEFEYNRFVQEKLDRDQEDPSKISEEESEENKRLSESYQKIHALIQKDEDSVKALRASRSGPENYAILATEEAEAKFDQE